MHPKRCLVALVLLAFVATSCASDGDTTDLAADEASSLAPPATTAPILVDPQPTIQATGSTSPSAAASPVPTQPPPTATPIPLPTQVPSDEVQGTQQQAQQPSTSSGAGAGLAPEAAEMLAAHNAVRAETGVAPLVWNAEIEAASLVWSQNMAANNSLQHDPNIFSVPGRFNAENISMQLPSTSPDSVVRDSTNGWANQSERNAFAATAGCPNLFDDNGVVCGHYKNIIDPDLTQLGCGVTDTATHRFWVCRFRV